MATKLAGLVDVSFDSGGHMVVWARTLRRALVLYEALVLGARAEVFAALSHQRWRVLQGELPPRVRAVLVVMRLSMLLAAVRQAIRCVEAFDGAVMGMYIEPAKAAAREGRAL